MFNIRTPTTANLHLKTKYKGMTFGADLQRQDMRATPDEVSDRMTLKLGRCKQMNVQSKVT